MDDGALADQISELMAAYGTLVKKDTLDGDLSIAGNMLQIIGKLTVVAAGKPGYHETFMTLSKDTEPLIFGGDENFTGLSYMTIPLSVWQTMAAMIFDGVLDRFPQLKFGAIELGASWLPSWLKFLDSGFNAFRKGEERLQKLSAPPSEIAARQFRVTPYPHEPTNWIMANSGEDMLLFSSDFPHVEGGRNPLKRFNDALEGVSEAGRQRFFRDNFIDLMGQGLDPALHGQV